MSLSDDSAACRGLTRRALLGGAGALALCAPLAAPAQPLRTTVVQLLDMSPLQQEVSRDYSTGFRTAWSEAGMPPASLLTLNINGGAGSLTLEEALRRVAADAGIGALAGTVGEPLALACVEACRQRRLEIAHVAPWLSDSRHDGLPGLLPIFASRDTQVQRAIESLGQAGHRSLQVVYPTPSDEAQQAPAVRQLAERLKLQLSTLTGRPGEDAGALAARLPADGPAMVLFFGGTLELAGFAQRLAARQLARYLICLADVDLAVLRQLGVGAHPKLALILTQVAPDPGGTQPLVLRFRSGLQKWFDEAPTPVSLAGYLAGRYTLALLQRASGAGRAGLFAAARERPALELEGFAIQFGGQARGSTRVVHALLTADGRLLR